MNADDPIDPIREATLRGILQGAVPDGDAPLVADLELLDHVRHEGDLRRSRKLAGIAAIVVLLFAAPILAATRGSGGDAPVDLASDGSASTVAVPGTTDDCDARKREIDALISTLVARQQPMISKYRQIWDRQKNGPSGTSASESEVNLVIEVNLLESRIGMLRSWRCGEPVPTWGEIAGPVTTFPCPPVTTIKTDSADADLAGGRCTVVPTEPPSTQPPDTATTVPPSSTNTTVPPSTGHTTVPPTTGTTRPPTTQTTTTNTTNPNVVNCGGSTPSGWPTTTAFLPSRAQCLLDAFAIGQKATFLVRLYEPPAGSQDDTQYAVQWDYEVIGVQKVRVREDTTKSGTRPPGITVKECTSLTYVQGTGRVFSYDGCTTVG